MHPMRRGHVQYGDGAYFPVYDGMPCWRVQHGRGVDFKLQDLRYRYMRFVPLGIIQYGRGNNVNVHGLRGRYVQRTVNGAHGSVFYIVWCGIL